MMTPVVPTMPGTAVESSSPKHYEESTQKKYQKTITTVKGMDKEERAQKLWQIEHLTNNEIEDILHLNEYTATPLRSFIVPSSGPNSGSKLSIQFDMNQVASNNPIEDYMAWGPVRKTDPKIEGGGNQKSVMSKLMFSVFDGHAGYKCAEKITESISSVLNESIAAVARIHQNQKQSQKNNRVDSSSREKEFTLDSTIHSIVEKSGTEIDPTTLALTASFVHLDRIIVGESLRKYRENPTPENMDNLLGPAVSGSCALVAVVDVDESKVTVANSGDSRAILGVRTPQGRWRAVNLSVDQNPNNPLEFARLIKDHPGEEETLNIKGRLIGKLAVSRAFGDCRYKWPRDVQEELFPELYKRGHGYATLSDHFYTPPYLTAYPDIVEHRLNYETDKFILMASDGLQVHMSDQLAVETVGEWWDVNKGKNSGGSDKSSIKDENAATHLIREAFCINKFGDKVPKLIEKLLAIPPPYSRKYRDDLSVSIIFLDKE